jgi:hypothetical protein
VSASRVRCPIFAAMRTRRGLASMSAVDGRILVVYHPTFVKLAHRLVFDERDDVAQVRR